MRLCVFEDRAVALLDPLTLTRPAFDLICGSVSLLERQRRHFGPAECAALVRPYLAAWCRQAHPDLAVNDPAWLRRGPAVLVNARWLTPSDPPPDTSAPHVGVVGTQTAYAVLPGDSGDEWAHETVDDGLKRWLRRLPQRPAGGALIDFPWDPVEHNPDALRADWEWRRHGPALARPPDGLTVLGPPERVVVHPEAAVEPLTVADTRQGPVMIDRGAVVQSFTRLEGPCYVGPRTWLLGAKVRGGTLGPVCRVGGEVEASILHGHANKYHEGFLGHSYVGEWVNLAAGTQTSDLRNDYGPITMLVAGRKVRTRLTKIGTLLGDHTKTALGTLLNTGTVVGAFCNLLPSGGLLPRVIPAFCTVRDGKLYERTDLRQLFATAATAMGRRGHELTAVHTELYHALYDQTIARRRRALSEGEPPRLRRVP